VGAAIEFRAQSAAMKVNRRSHLTVRRQTGISMIHTYILVGLHTCTYIHQSCSAPFTIKTRPTVHFGVNTE